MELAANFMNDSQINRARKEGELVICPYSEKNLTPVGYNLSFSRFIVSLRKRAFVKIKHKGNEWYFKLKPSETVLVLTRETIWVSKFIGGTFHSKVSMVTKGLGHVSTTLDPGWYGQLLVPLNNPTKEPIKVVIAVDGRNGKEFQTFMTMVLFRSQEAALRTRSDNKAARIELLEEILSEKKHNADAKYLKQLIEKLKNSISKIEIFTDLNDPTDRKQKIKRFQQEHLQMIEEMDNEFERLNKFSEVMYNWRAFWYIAGILVFGIVLIGVNIFVVMKLKTNVKELASIITSVVVSLGVLIFSYFKDKFI